jgi:predicted DNA-binding transcriptional regulator AlpA
MSAIETAAEQARRETAAQRARRMIEAPSRARRQREDLKKTVELPEAPPVKPSATGPPLPSVTMLRFNDLKRLGLAPTYAVLRRRVANEGFPEGVWLSQNVRAWSLASIEAWIASRPSEREDTTAIMKSRARQRRLRRERASKVSA